MASEAFNDFLTALIASGSIAEDELKSLLKAHEFQTRKGFYPE